MRPRRRASLPGRTLLILLTVYGLAMIVPDLWRIAHPLGSFGVSASNDGTIFDVRGPFDTDAGSPAWQAGIRPGDALDLSRMRCIPIGTDACASVLALWGGLNYVMPGREATLMLVANGDQPARAVTLVARPRTRGLLLDSVLVLDQLAGVLFLLGAAWMVWTRPGPMTWGFFAYAIEFSPGQPFQFYAWLQQWPSALLAQEIASCVLQAAGYTGFLLFALRVPFNAPDARWRRVEQTLPVLAVGFLAIELASLGTAFGHRAETAMRAALLLGFAVDIAALGILVARRNHLAPRDYQRIRWVIWGCLIGLPAYLVAAICQETSLPTLFGATVMPEAPAGILYLVNGVLCLFVIEAVRRPTVVSVSIPLRRATMLGLVLSLPALFLHRQLELLDEMVHMPGWAWIMVASVLAYLISRLHEFTTDLADRLFDLRFRRAEIFLAEVGDRIQHAHSLAEIERLLVNEPLHSLGLASAALFREQDGVFHRQAGTGWDATDVEVLDAGDPLLRPRLGGVPFELDRISEGDARLPGDLARPLLGVPVGNPRHCFAVVLYGGHEAGTDLAGNERHLLAGLARKAEIAYGQVEREWLHRQIATLKTQIARSSVAV